MQKKLAVPILNIKFDQLFKSSLLKFLFYNIFINLLINLIFMKIILNILTLGIYSLFSKAKDVNLKTKKLKYREDGTLKKEVIRDVDYSEGEGPTELPK